MHITGEVENMGTTNASSLVVYATCYDIDGKVVTVFHDTSAQLIPGQKLPFEILIQSEVVPLAKSYVVGAKSHEYASFEFSAVPTPVNKAASVTILSHSGYLESIGDYHIIGEVQNLDTTPIEWVNITTTFYDSSNTIIVVENSFSTLDVILPNRKSPFEFWLFDKTQASRVDHYALVVASAFEALAPPLSLKILSSSVNLDIFGYLNITGEVENIGTTNATYTKVIATFYDSDGKFVSQGSDYAESYFWDSHALPPGQKSSFTFLINLGDKAPLAKSYVLTAESDEYECLEFSSLPLPSMSTSPTESSTPTISPSVSPTSSIVTPSPSPLTIAEIVSTPWVPQPTNAAAATVVTAVAVGVISVAIAAATNPVASSAGQAAAKVGPLPDSVNKWLTEYMSSKRKPPLDKIKGSPFKITKAETLAYGVSLIVMTIAFSYAKVPNFTQILAVMPTILVTAVIIELGKTFSLIAFARYLGVWTEHRLWYVGLAMFLITAFVFGMPFSSPSRTLYYTPELTKRREGIVATAAILITLAFAAIFFALLICGFPLIGGMGMGICLIMAFIDTFPVAPMNGKVVYTYKKATWAILFAATLALYIAWLILINK